MYSSDFDTAAAEAALSLSQDASLTRFASVPLASAMLDKSNVAEARQTYARLADRDRGLATLGLADLTLYVGDAHEAERILASEIRAPEAPRQTSARVYALLGEAYVVQERTAAAIDAVRKALELNRNFATVFTAARVFLEARQYSDATSLASESAKMEGGVGLAYARIIENHQGLPNELIDGRPAKGRAGRVCRHRRLGGLLNYYARAA